MVIPNETINWHYPRTDLAKSYLDTLHAWYLPARAPTSTHR